MVNAMTGRRLLFLATSIVHLFVEPQIAGAESAGVDALAAQYLPFQATVDAVIEQGSIEGYPMAVVRFRSHLPIDEALALTTRVWRRSGVSLLVTRAGVWRVVSLYEAGRYRTLQIRPTVQGGSEGLLSAWSGGPRVAASSGDGTDPEHLLPAGARVLRRLDGVDTGRRHRTLVAVAEGSPGWVTQALELRMAAQGFTRDPILHASAGGDPDGEARLYRRSEIEVAVTVHAHHGRSAIVIHLTEAVR
jgi:hypothetical protein